MERKIPEWVKLSLGEVDERDGQAVEITSPGSENVEEATLANREGATLHLARRTSEPATHRKIEDIMYRTQYAVLYWGLFSCMEMCQNNHIRANHMTDLVASLGSRRASLTMVGRVCLHHRSRPTDHVFHILLN
jgi:hypothetical protein